MACPKCQGKRMIISLRAGLNICHIPSVFRPPKTSQYAPHTLNRHTKSLRVIACLQSHFRFEACGRVDRNFPWHCLSNQMLVRTNYPHIEISKSHSCLPVPQNDIREQSPKKISRLLKNDHLLRFPAYRQAGLSFPVSSTGQAYCGVLLQVRVVCQFVGLRISGALHLGIFEQP